MQNNEVQVTYTFNLDQVNVILEALSGMPFSRVDQLINGMRQIALTAIREAELAEHTSEKTVEPEATAH